MKVKLYLRRKIAAAHFLPDYEGDCSKMHGHTFLIHLELEGAIKAETGMLADFREVKDIIDTLDHQTLNDFIPVPTAENIAQYYLTRIPYCVKVTVWESENCAAQVAWRPPMQKGHWWNPPDDEWLYSQYVTQEKTRNQISKEVGASPPTVKKWILEAGILLRTPWKVPSREWLYDQYITQGKSASLIADEVGTGTKVIINKLREFGIKSRTLAQAQSLRRQQEFPYLKGQPSLRTCRRRAEEALWAAGVLEVCARCGQNSSDVWVEVHHKDGNERNNALENLQWLCRSCHTRHHWGSRGEVHHAT